MVAQPAVSITLPDGTQREFPAGLTVKEIAERISPGLARRALVAKVNGEPVDLSRSVNSDVRLEILTARDPETLEMYRHSSAHLLAAASFIVLLSVFSFLMKGVWGLLTTLALFATSLYAFILWRAAATRETLRQQLPGFIDQLIRAMGIGRSFESALLQAIDDSPHPLSAALESVKVESSLGGDVADSLKNAAELYRMKELHLLTLALRINRRYGGSIKAMLENIIAMIRHREQAERELRALTGETRLSAWVLGTIPVLMAAYMLITNPTYIGYLLNHPHGMAIVYTALGLQATGALLLWRMMRSIR